MYVFYIVCFSVFCVLAMLFFFCRYCRKASTSATSPFIAARLIGQLKDDKTWHASLLVRLWESQCQRLNSGVLTSCKLFKNPQRICVGKHTVFVGSVCQVVHTQTWCLLTALWEESDTIGFNAVALRLKSSDAYSSTWEKTSTQHRYIVNSKVSLVIPPWWYQLDGGDITTLQ